MFNHIFVAPDFCVNFIQGLPDERNTSNEGIRLVLKENALQP